MLECIKRMATDARILQRSKWMISYCQYKVTESVISGNKYLRINKKGVDVYKTDGYK